MEKLLTMNSPLGKYLKHSFPFRFFQFYPIGLIVRKKLKLIKCDFQVLTYTSSVPFLPLGCSTFSQPSATTGLSKVSLNVPAESTMLRSLLKFFWTIRLMPLFKQLTTELGFGVFLGNYKYFKTMA